MKTKIASIPTLGIYIRVSSARQVEKGLSADDQKERGIKLATEMGWGYKLYDDRGVSASKISFKDRHLNELVKDCQSKSLDGIYCVEIDRWSRDKNYEEGQVIITLIKASGVKVFTPTGEYELSDPSVEFLVRLKSLFASFETQNRVSSIKRNLENSVKKGRAGGGTMQPYGYKKDENKMLVIDEEEAETVKQIYQLAIKGNGTKVISNILNEQGTPTKRARVEKGYMEVRGQRQTKFRWSDAVVYAILTNPIYIGQRRFKDEFVPAPRILEDGTFYTIQELLKKRNHFKDTTNEYHYLLKGLVFCGKCGKPFHGHKRANGKDNAYVCNSKRVKAGFCGNQGINIDYFEKLVWDQVFQLDKLVIKYYEWYKSKTGTDAKMTEIQAIRIQEIEKQERLNNLIEALETKSINAKVVGERMAILEKEIEELGKKKNDMLISLSILDKEKEVLSFIRQHFPHHQGKPSPLKYSAQHQMYSFDRKQEILRALVDRIILTFNGKEHSINIEYKISELSSVKLGKKLDLTSNIIEKKKQRSVTTSYLQIRQDVDSNTIDIDFV